MPWLRSVALAAVLIIGTSSSALAEKRIELYDAQGQHSGYAIMERRAGRVDYYDLRDRRIGWGRVNPLGERYRVDLFASDGMAVGYALVDLETRRAEFFNATSHPIGTGTLDETGLVAAFDVSGRRRTDLALPIPSMRPARASAPGPLKD